ncbi:MAG: T9SS type A sorting domain-containing protein, partial [Bacteroidetes bacterium]|nr:T9SS type A sorting domain-containing protein [Bacteroidota bacterium]
MVLSLLPSNSDTIFDGVSVLTFDGGIAYPFVETFEDVLEFDSLWTVINSNEDNHYWRTSLLAPYSGDRSLWIRSNSNTVNNAIDEIISPFIDLSSSPDTTVISFMISTAQNGSANDRLEVLFTRNCGDTWNKFYSKSGTDLSTVTVSTNNYKPTSSADWRLEQIVLPIGYNVSDVQFKFRFKSNLGSNLFIDDINYSIVGVNDRSIERTVRIFPNPVNKNSVIEFNSEGNQKAQVQIVDIMGRTVARIPGVKMNKGNNQINIGSHLKIKGTYFVRLTVDTH